MKTAMRAAFEAIRVADPSAGIVKQIVRVANQQDQKREQSKRGAKRKPTRKQGGMQ